MPRFRLFKSDCFPCLTRLNGGTLFTIASNEWRFAGDFHSKLVNLIPTKQKNHMTYDPLMFGVVDSYAFGCRNTRSFPHERKTLTFHLSWKFSQWRFIRLKKEFVPYGTTREYVSRGIINLPWISMLNRKND